MQLQFGIDFEYACMMLVLRLPDPDNDLIRGTQKDGCFKDRQDRESVGLTQRRHA